MRVNRRVIVICASPRVFPCQAGWSGVRWRVEHVTVMAREGADGQFQPHFQIPLGGGAPTILGVGAEFAGMPHTREAFTLQQRPGRTRSKRRQKDK